MALALIISFLFLLLILLGDNEFGFVILGVSSLLLLIFSKKLIDKNRIKQFFSKKEFRLLFLIIAVFLLSASISLFYTPNLPLSIERLMDLYFVFAVFFFFLFLKKEYLGKEQFLTIFNLLFLVLGILVSSLAIFPNLAKYLPGMNMLFATYGHNHFAALLLLVMPFFWWQYFQSKKKSFLFLVLFFYLLIFLSLARVVILLTIFQFLFLLLNNGESFMTLRKKERKIFLVPLILLSIFFVTMLALSFPKAFKIESICDFRGAKLCKDFSYEGRKGYWSSAVEIFRSGPVFGTGLNSYALLNRQYLHYGASLSSYTHNEYLQIFSDLGLVGGISFLLLFIYVFYLSSKSLHKNSKFSLEKALLIGVFFIAINSLFDFDWQFVAIFALTMAFLAIILRVVLDKKQKVNNRVMGGKLFFTFYFILNVSVFLFFSLNLFNRIFLIFGQKSLAFAIYPFSRHQMLDFARDLDLSEEEKEKLWRIHQKDNYFLNNILETEENFYNKQQIWKDFIKLHPLIIGSERFSNFVKESLVNGEDYLLIKDLIFSAVDWIAIEIEEEYYVAEEIREEIGDLLLSLIAVAEEKEDWETIGSAYYQYSRILEYLPQEYYPQFLTEKPSVELTPLIIALKEFNPQLFRNENIAFSDFYLRVVEETLVDGQDELAYSFYENIIHPSSTNDIISFGDISDFLLREQLNVLNKGNYSLESLANFTDFYLVYKDEYWNYFYRRDLAKQLIVVANDIYQIKPALAFNYYFLAHLLNEWSLIENKNYLPNLMNKDLFEREEAKRGLNYFLNQLNDEDFTAQFNRVFYQGLENYRFHK